MLLGFVRKCIFNLGVYIRNPSFESKFSALLRSDRATREELDNISKKKLASLLIFAGKYSDYYAEKFKFLDIGFSDDSNIFDVLKRIPTTTKADLILHNERISTHKRFKFKKLFFSETSGSSGEPLTFYKNEEWDSANRAAIARGMKWYGVNPSDRNGYFWGYSFSTFQMLKTRFFDFLLNRFRLFSYNDKDIAHFMDKAASDCVYIHGYSSMIYEVARKANSQSLKLNRIKFIKGTSEKIYDHYHEESIKAFGKKIVSEYGAAEAGIIAFECPEGRMHINEENCLVEVIDNKIVITNFESYSFPIIRYELGDFVTISEESCPCGRQHKVINEVLGRVGKNIYGFDDCSYPSLTLYYIFKRLALECGHVVNYRAEQRKIGYLTIFIEGEIEPMIRSNIMEISRSYFSDSIILDLVCEVSIHSKTKKLKDFESFVQRES